MAFVQCFGYRTCQTRIRDGRKGFDGWCARCRRAHTRAVKPPRDRAAIGRHAKRKGAKAELEAIRIIQPWWRRLEPQALFVRTPGSGGWKHSTSFKARGDLQVDPATTRLFPFSVEVKKREGWSDGLLFGDAIKRGDASPIWAWWEQTRAAALADGFRPMLWFTKNNSPWYVMIEAGVYDELRLRGMTPPLVRFDDPRHTVVLSHAQIIWIPPRAFVAACESFTNRKAIEQYGTAR